MKTGQDCVDEWNDDCDMGDVRLARIIDDAIRTAFASGKEAGRAEGFTRGITEAVRIAGTVEWCKECLATDQIADQLAALLPPTSEPTTITEALKLGKDLTLRTPSGDGVVTVRHAVAPASHEPTCNDEHAENIVDELLRRSNPVGDGERRVLFRRDQSPKSETTPAVDDIRARQARCMHTDKSHGGTTCMRCGMMFGVPAASAPPSVPATAVSEAVKAWRALSQGERQDVLDDIGLGRAASLHRRIAARLLRDIGLSRDVTVPATAVMTLRNALDSAANTLRWASRLAQLNPTPDYKHDLRVAADRADDVLRAFAAGDEGGTR